MIKSENRSVFDDLARDFNIYRNRDAYNGTNAFYLDEYFSKCCDHLEELNDLGYSCLDCRHLNHKNYKCTRVGAEEYSAYVDRVGCFAIEPKELVDNMWSLL
jgi:hypothetical protein